MVVKNPEQWRAITPWVTITNLFVSALVAIIGFFLIRTLDQLEGAIVTQTGRIDQIVVDSHKKDVEDEQRYSQLRYQCCSEIKNYSDSNIEHDQSKYYAESSN